VRHTAGGFIVAFQLLLILSGNLSFLNWLTMVIALGCFDDSLYGRLLPESLCQRFERAERGASVTKARRITVGVLTFIVAVLSLNPVVNMLSPRQAMNASFEPLGLVNTYGAFGSIERERREVILEGTTDPFLSAETRWFAYELPCKPGDIYRRPCVRAPYHYRLDWQMWFAGISGNYRYEPWIVHLVYKLLRGNHEVDRLFAYNPFPKRPPRFVRARYYRYHFTRLGDKSGAWWRRELIGDYLRPLSLDNLDFQVFLADRGWWKGLPNQ
jgi:hypothetical protein